MAEVLYLPTFRQDIQDALIWSEERFGSAAADRYAELIRTALRDLLDDPVRPGSRKRPELARNAFVYHLRFSKNRVPPERRVKTPRHFIVYRYNDSRIEFARLLHDSRDFSVVTLR